MALIDEADLLPEAVARPAGQRRRSLCTGREGLLSGIGPGQIEQCRSLGQEVGIAVFVDEIACRLSPIARRE